MASEQIGSGPDRATRFLAIGLAMGGVAGSASWIATGNPLWMVVIVVLGAAIGFLVGHAP